MNMSCAHTPSQNKSHRETSAVSRLPSPTCPLPSFLSIVPLIASSPSLALPLQLGLRPSPNPSVWHLLSSHLAYYNGTSTLLQQAAIMLKIWCLMKTNLKIGL